MLTDGFFLRFFPAGHETNGTSTQGLFLNRLMHLPSLRLILRSFWRWFVEMEVEKSVLVTVCGRNRIVKFCSMNSSPPSDKRILSTAVKAAFKDVLPAEQDFFFR